MYNTKEDVDKLIISIKKVIEVFKWMTGMIYI
jgi:hypothetical protein